jgi:hypothetical protein
VRRGRQELPAERQPLRLQHLQVARAARALALAFTLAACTKPQIHGAPSPTAIADAHGADATTDAGAGDVGASDAGGSDPSASDAGARDADARDGSSAATTNARAQLDPDGNDDPEDPGQGAAPTAGHFEKVGTPPLALTRICDLTPSGDTLYMAHANVPLGTDGATITRYRPHDDKKLSVAFDWNRPGEPTKGGGAGQGFLRVHRIGGRLFVPDADPPYGGLGLVDHGTEGYVFVSDRAGNFARARAPHYRPPAAPDLARDGEGAVDGGAGAAVLPRAYHVIDAIRFRGALYASTGSVPPKERAWSGPSPGALHRASSDGARWTYEVDYPYPYKNGVWRLTFLVRFRDRLYAGIQDYDGREPNDYVYFAPTSAEPGLRREDLHAVRVTRTGAAETLRWWVDDRASPPRLYWLAWARDGVVLRVTTDGDHWAAIPLPDDAGRPTDVTRFRDAVVVLAERGLYRLEGDAMLGDVHEGVLDAIAKPVAPVTEKKSPFVLDDFFCAAPIAVFENALYAGGQRGGTLYRLAEQ